MSGIEFLDEPDGSDESDESDGPETASQPDRRGGVPHEGPGGPDAPSRLQEAASALLFAAAAALSVVAATSRLYTIGFGPGGRQFPYGVDAFGTYHGIGEAALQGTRGPRYAWALIGCAVVLAVLALQVAAPALRLPVGRRLAPAVTYVATGVTGVLGGVTLAAYLDISAALESARSRTVVGVQEGDPLRPDISTRFGPAVWLAVAALGCAVAAVGLGVAVRGFRVTRRASSSPGG